MIRRLRDLREIGEVAARGHGQILFCESAAAGIVLLAATALVSPVSAAFAAIGGLTATLAARALRLPEAQWRAGLHGYSGSLAGLFWGALFAPSPAAVAALVAAAALAAPLTCAAHRTLTPGEIPTLALPALVLTWMAVPLLDPAAPEPPWPVATQAAAWGTAVLAVGLHSRLLAAGALLGGGVGVLVSVLATGRPDPVIVANAVPTAMALSAVLLPWTAGAVVVAAGGAALAAGLAWAAAPAPAPPLLVAPFTLVTIAAVVAVRWLASRSVISGVPRPRRLALVTTPEDTRTAWRARCELAARMRDAGRICVFTGAGVSTAAGLPDVRGAAELRARTPRVALEEFAMSAATRAAYWREEEAFFRLVQRAAPAPVHRALAHLWARARLSAVVTQNVDGLHRAAGLPASAVVELHGSVHQARCLDCGHAVPRATLSARAARGAEIYCPRCGGLLKGGGTMFGESIDPARLDAALRALLDADLLLVLGTSLRVAPASDILRWARDGGIPVAIVNATATDLDEAAAVVLRDDVNDVLADLAARIEPRRSRSRGAASPSVTAS